MVGLLLAAIIANYVDRQALSVAAVPLMRHFEISPATMGALLSAFFWSYALLQIPTGYLVDRFGLRWTYGAAFLLWSLASAAVGWATSVPQIFLLRLLVGAGQAAAQPASLSYIRKNFATSQQGLPTAVYLSGMQMGPAIASFLGGELLETAGWQMLFLLTGLAPLVWLIPWLLLAPARSATHAAAPPGAPSAPTARVPWKLLFGLPSCWGVLTSAFFYAYYWYFCLTWLPSYLVMERGFSYRKMGAYTALPFLGTALVSMTFARLADRRIARHGRPVQVRRLFVAAGFLLGSVILFVPAAGSSAAVLAILTISLIGIGVAAGNHWSLTQAFSPAPIIGRIVGVQNTVANFAGICAPMLTGHIVGRNKNFALAMIFAGSAMLIASAANLLVIRQRDADTLQAIFERPAA